MRRTTARASGWACARGRVLAACAPSASAKRQRRSSTARARARRRSHRRGGACSSMFVAHDAGGYAAVLHVPIRAHRAPATRRGRRLRRLTIREQRGVVGRVPIAFRGPRPHMLPISGHHLDVERHERHGRDEVLDPPSQLPDGADKHLEHVAALRATCSSSSQQGEGRRWHEGRWHAAAQQGGRARRRRRRARRRSEAARDRRADLGRDAASASPCSRGRARAPARAAPRARRGARTRRRCGVMALDHLIMVAGHAVTIKGDLTAVDRDERTWYLLPYQTGQDLPAEFVRHIREGVSLAAADPRSLLVFSGGQTRGDAGPRSEGASYWLVAERFAWWGHVATVGARARPRRSTRATRSRTCSSRSAASVSSRARTRAARDGRLFLVQAPTLRAGLGARFARASARGTDRRARSRHSARAPPPSQVHARALRLPAASFRFVGVRPDAGLALRRGERRARRARGRARAVSARPVRLRAARARRRPAAREAPRPRPVRAYGPLRAFVPGTPAAAPRWCGPASSTSSRWFGGPR